MTTTVYSKVLACVAYHCVSASDRCGRNCGRSGDHWDEWTVWAVVMVVVVDPLSSATYAVNSSLIEWLNDNWFDRKWETKAMNELMSQRVVSIDVTDSEWVSHCLSGFSYKSMSFDSKLLSTIYTVRHMCEMGHFDYDMIWEK